MRFIEPAVLADVILACDKDPDTQRRLREHAPYGRWFFDNADLGSIGGQLQTGEVGAVAALAARWASWMQTQAGRADRASHEHFLGQLQAGHTFEHRPILYWAPGHSPRQVLDGRHRLFAAFDYAQVQPAFELEIFWSERGRQREGR